MRQCGRLLFRRRVCFWLIYKDIPRVQLVAVSEHDIHDESDGPAVLCGRRRESDMVARLEGIIGPAEIGHAQRVLRLQDPMDSLAAVLGRVYEEQAMGIAPNPLLDSTLYRNRLTDIVGRPAMMRQRRPASYCCHRTQYNHHQ